MAIWSLGDETNRKGANNKGLSMDSMTIRMAANVRCNDCKCTG